MAFKPPEVDISPWVVGSEAGDERSPAALQSAQSLVKNMKNIGLVAIKNHGIDSAKITNTFDKLNKFFEKPKEEKAKYTRSRDVPIGYHPLGRFREKKERTVDHLEGFNFNHRMMKPEDWPEDLVPGVKQIVTDHTKASFQIGRDIYMAMAVGLGVKDEDCFTRGLSGHETNVNIRFNYYVPSPEPEENETRLAEHQDGSAMNLLFMDGKKGLQIKLSDGNWVDVHSEANDLLLFCGTLMEVWTADAIKAVRHRVLVPEGSERLVSRSSLATFIDPNPDFVVQCIDGSNKYEPTTLMDHVMKIYKSTHTY